MLRKKLQLYESNDTNRNITVRDALIMIKEAWDQVTPPTIINCFVKGGFEVARIRGEMMDEQEAEEAARVEAEATSLLNVQVRRYNELVTTNPTI